MGTRAERKNMLNYKEYVRVADYKGAAALIDRAARTSQASEDWKKRVLAERKNVGGITRVKKGE